ncbi:hypothetical protein ECAE60S_04577 [Eoetvoesiella caeni]
MTFDVLDENATFFAPVSTDLIDSLIGQYRQERGYIDDIAQFISTGDYSTTVKYFLDGNRSDDGRNSISNVENLFDPNGAIKSLNASYWNRALSLTDVLDCMPELRRQEWFKQIKEKDTPEFEEETVRSTLMDLLASRTKFFAERVDGIFQALSSEHVTNLPQGFSRRMILYFIFSSYGTDRTGYINDLRSVIAKLTGRQDTLKYNSTYRLVHKLQKHTGQWFDVDGGALRIRLYKKGTAHLEVHPDIAWKLNQVLAYLHPAVIPAEFRTPPKRRPKLHKVMQRPLPFAVVELIAEAHQVPSNQGYEYALPFPNSLTQAPGARDEAAKILQSIGGVRVGRSDNFTFDYCPDDVLDEIAMNGCIPDQKSHQYYGTVSKLAKVVIEKADIKPEHECIEPSAGQGGLADFMPKAQTTCIEISALHCGILKAKGHTAIQADFLIWHVGQPQVDRVILNPPFNEGRWQEHLLAAAEMVKPGGRLVAILPSGARHRELLVGWECHWSSVYDDEFPGTSVSVVILTADRPV